MSFLYRWTDDSDQELGCLKVAYRSNVTGHIEISAVVFSYGDAGRRPQRATEFDLDLTASSSAIILYWTLAVGSN